MALSVCNNFPRQKKKIVITVNFENIFGVREEEYDSRNWKKKVVGNPYLVTGRFLGYPTPPPQEQREMQVGV